MSLTFRDRLRWAETVAVVRATPDAGLAVLCRADGDLGRVARSEVALRHVEAALALLPQPTPQEDAPCQT